MKLENDFEKNLIDTLDFFPEVILESTLKLQTHNITQYAIELAKDFQIFYETSNCVNVKNSHGFYPAQGAGGRIIKLDNSNILFITNEKFIIVIKNFSSYSSLI